MSKKKVNIAKWQKEGGTVTHAQWEETKAKAAKARKAAMAKQHPYLGLPEDEQTPEKPC